jgi:hypothetical protein
MSYSFFMHCFAVLNIFVYERMKIHTCERMFHTEISNDIRLFQEIVHRVLE